MARDNMGKAQGIALLILRVGAGAMLATHGFSKIIGIDGTVAGFSAAVGKLGFPAPLAFAWAAALAESVGAVLVAIGLWTRPAAAAAAFTMGVAVYHHRHDGFQVAEKALLYLTCYLAVLLAGAGPYSFDARGQTKPSPKVR